MKMSLQVIGDKELLAELNKLSTRINKRLAREALEFGAEPIRAEAARKAPRKPPAPDLADHMIIAPARAIGSEIAAVKVGPERGTYWGLFQELGTARHGAQPFLRPAFDTQQARAVKRVAEELWRALASRGVSRTSVFDGYAESPGGSGLL
jgi:HK97 gp10 family phage protein